MKKAVLLLIMSALAFGLQAQNCIPDTSITKPGIYPNYLDTGVVGTAYEHTLQILAIRDTQVVFGGTTITAQVDSIVLVDIEGLPPSFSHGCEPKSCTFTHLEVGCAKIWGAPDAGEMGTHPLNIIITSYAQYSGIPITVTDTLTDFVLVVNDSSFSAIAERELNTALIAPNPSVEGELQLTSRLPMHTVRVTDQSGREVSSYRVHDQRFIKLDLQHLSSGMYQLFIATDAGMIHQRWIRL